MGTLITIIIILAVLYCGAGAVMAWYESSQTDNPIDWMNIIMWLPKMLGKG